MKILIAEDDYELRKVMKKLMAFSGLDCDVVSNGLEALKLAKIREGEYDLCLMDINMPILDGFLAAEIMRQSIRYFPSWDFPRGQEERGQISA